MRVQFGHSPSTIRFWRLLAQRGLRTQPTPFYVFSLKPVEAALAELQRQFGHLPVRHWLSCKTQPFPPLLRWWRKQGLGIEVVSEFELRAALQEGFQPERILVNGPAKHHWLSKHAVRNLLVNLDSPAEATALIPLASKLNWRLGLRINTHEEFDPENPEYPTQFGFAPGDAVTWMRKLSREKASFEIVHFHLRTNVKCASVYAKALQEIAGMCREAGVWPKVIDCGGGFPAPHVLDRAGSPLNTDFSLDDMAKVYERALKLFPGLREIWLENGRWLTARSGALVLKILDVKERGKMRILICNGGRTLNALVSNWEMHELISVPERRGPTCLTTVNGPTCMAFDQLARRQLPKSLAVGDHLIWLDAGAYHLPWETRFSHGHAAVLWHDGESMKLVRDAQSFENWWAQWK